MTHPSDDDEFATVLSVRLGCLAAGGELREPRPTFDELGLFPLIQQAVHWQQVRAHSWFTEINAMFKGPHQQDRWRELGQLFGSAAESILLVCAAEVEVTLLDRAIKQGKRQPFWYMSMRFFAESQGNQLLGFGHRCVNILLRALVLDVAYPFNLQVKAFPRPPVFSSSRDDWLSLSRVKDLKIIADASPHAGLRELSSSLYQLWSSNEWQAVDRLRAREFHQSRPESPIVSRSARVTAWERRPGQRALNLGPDMTPTPAEAGAEIDQLLAIIRAVVDTLPEFMERFLNAWLEAMETLGHGKRTDDGRMHYTTG